TLASRAGDLLKLRRYTEALADWNTALEYDDSSRRSDLLLGRAECLARAGQPARAAAEIDAVLPQLGDAGDVYDAACVLALASAVKDDTAAADRHAARAVAVLRQAFVRGYADIAHMLRDSDLDPLRQRD